MKRRGRGDGLERGRGRHKWWRRRGSGRGTEPGARVEDQQTNDIEAALEAQRARAAASSPPPAPMEVVSPRALPGFEYDAERGRYFRSSRRGGRSPSTTSRSTFSSSIPNQRYEAGSLSSESVNEPPSSPPRRSRPISFLQSLRNREIRGFSHDVLSALIRYLHMHHQKIGHVPELEDLDCHQSGKVLAGTRGGLVTIIEKDPATGIFHLINTLSCASPVCCVRWRSLSSSSCSSTSVTSSSSSSSSAGGGMMFAVGESGSGTASAAITLVRLSHNDISGGGGGSNEDRGLACRLDRFVIKKESLWTVAWEPCQGKKVVGGVSKGQPLIVLDIGGGAAIRQTSQHVVESDAFSCCWYDESSVLIGMRNGHVGLVDLRSRSTSSMVLARMPTSIDQQRLLRDGKGLLISDRTGNLHLYDLRRPARVVSELVGHQAALASRTGFTMDPPEKLCLAVGNDGIVRIWDLSTSHIYRREAIKTWSWGAAGGGGRVPGVSKLFICASSWNTDAAGRSVAVDASLQQQQYLMRDTSVWPQLWAGDRQTGGIYNLGMYREAPFNVGMFI